MHHVIKCPANLINTAPASSSSLSIPIPDPTTNAYGRNSSSSSILAARNEDHAGYDQQVELANPNIYSQDRWSSMATIQTPAFTVPAPFTINNNGDPLSYDSGNDWMFGDQTLPSSSMAAVFRMNQHQSLISTPLYPAESMSITEQGPIGSSNTNIRPYKCTVAGCPKAYKNINGLKYHNKHGHASQTGNGAREKPWVCHIVGCIKTYSSKGGLVYHVKHYHPDDLWALP